MNSKSRSNMQQPQAMDIRPVRRKPAAPSKPKAAASAAAKRPDQQVSKNKPKRPSRLNGFIKRLQSHPLRQHPFIVPVTTVVILSFVSMIAYIAGNGRTLGPSDTKLVYLMVDGEEQTVPTRAKNVQELLGRLDIQVTEKDIVEPALETEIVSSESSVTVYKARPITIIDGAKQITTVAAGPTPREAVTRAGIAIYPEDKLEAHKEVVVTEDVLRGQPVAERFVIERAMPVTINLYGSVIPLRTHVMTVADAIKEKNIKTQPDDVITPAPNTILTAKTQIFITRVGTAIEAREEEIPMPVETIEDPNLQLGRSVIRQQGNPGRKVVTYEIKLENDKEVARHPIQEIVAVEAVKHVVVRGTKPPTVIVAGDHAALMLQAGIPASQHGAAEYIITRESGWRLNAQNAGGCLGLGQACPGSKLVNACPEYANDAICQLRFFTAYVNGRYGSWNGAYQFWIVNHWY